MSYYITILFWVSSKFFCERGKSSYVLHGTKGSFKTVATYRRGIKAANKTFYDWEQSLRIKKGFCTSYMMAKAFVKIPTLQNYYDFEGMYRALSMIALNL
jgi:hypothetical protein